jgi:hypothetical protein
MKNILYLNKEYHNNYAEITLTELTRDLHIIELQMNILSYLENSMYLYFVIPAFLKLSIHKEKKALREEWICLEFFISEQLKNKDKKVNSLQKVA